MPLKIISGKYRGRRIETLKDKALRPTTGRTREAVFNLLTHGKFLEGRNILDGANVLDLFCGSGALGMEALSRGATHATFMDANNRHLDVARNNVAHIGASGDASFVKTDSSNPPPARTQCDLVFLDPPYESGLAMPALQNLIKTHWLAEKAILVVELRKKENFLVPEGYQELDKRNYGITQIIILERQ